MEQIKINNPLVFKTQKEKEIFFNGAEVCSTISQNLSFSDVSNLYGMHLTTIRSWSQENLYDYKKGYKKMLYEFFRRYDKSNTIKYMSKYSLLSDNTEEFISEKFLMDIDEIQKMKESTTSWKEKIIDELLGINKQLFSIQVELIKQLSSHNFEEEEADK